VSASAKRDAPAFHRNVEPIRAVLARLLAGRSGELLEIASGTGQHAAALAPSFASFTWRPSDISADNLASIAAWAAESGATNIAAPIFVDAAAPDWGLRNAQDLPREIAVIFSCNMIHIAPWAAAAGLFAGAGARLAPAGLLILYGPFRHDGAHVAQSNERFDAWLKAQDASWGVRDTADLNALAARAGLHLVETIAMPANNHVLAFARA
jgi:SAM-dependent methyltransferase